MIALFFAKNWLGMAIGAALMAAVCAVPLTLMKHSRDMAVAETKVADAQRLQAEQRVETLGTAIANQNERIDAMHKEADAQVQHMNEIVKVRNEMLEAEKKAIQKAPAGAGEMNRWVNEVLK